jgi:predicted nucleotidyltransferase
MRETFEKAIAERFAKHPRISLGIVFGSMARAAERAESDLDIAVAGPRRLTVHEKIALIEQLAELARRPIDLVDLTAAGGLIVRQALTKGKLIYCDDRALYAELIKRMVFDQADFIPYRRRILAERRRRWIGA